MAPRTQLSPDENLPTVSPSELSSTYYAIIAPARSYLQNSGQGNDVLVVWKYGGHVLEYLLHL
jgi:hypothetical protein